MDTSDLKQLFQKFLFRYLKMVGYIRQNIGKCPDPQRVMIWNRNMMNSVFFCCKSNVASCLPGNLITEFSDYFD